MSLSPFLRALACAKLAKDGERGVAGALTARSSFETNVPEDGLGAATIFCRGAARSRCRCA
jgi:hypothetical protein